MSDPPRDPLWLRRFVNRLFPSVEEVAHRGSQSDTIPTADEPAVTPTGDNSPPAENLYSRTYRAIFPKAAAHYDEIGRQRRELLARSGYKAPNTPPPPPPQPRGLTYDDHFPPDVRARHLYVIGGTGSGKTTLIKNLLVGDINLGRGCAFIDPHGDAADDLLGHVYEGRLDDVIYFAPTSPTCPSFNPLAFPYPPHKLVADLVSLFRLFFDSWGPQLQMVLTHGLTALIDDREANQGPHTLADLRRLLTNEDYRDTITGRLPDQDDRDWWSVEFPALARNAVNPVLNKLDAFMPPGTPLKKLFSNPRNDLDFPAILNGKKIFLANLSKGELGQEPARLLGGMLTAAITNAALARATIPEADRIPFYFYADEFQTYTTESFETILDETRKYGLSLTIANQSFSRLPSGLQHAIKSNVRTLVAFQCSAEDARALTNEMRTQLVRIIGSNAEPHTVDEVNQNYYRRYPNDPPGEAERGLYNEIQNKNVELIDWPSVQDLVDLAPLNAIYRRTRASDVHRLSVAFLPPPNPATRAAILERQRARFTPPPPPPASATKPKEKKKAGMPQTEDDEFF